MKKILALLAAVILVLGLAACGGKQTPETTVPITAPITEPTTVPTEPTTVPTTAPTEPKSAAVIGDIDLYGKTVEEAAAALNEAAAAYKLTLTVNGKKLSFTAEELGLKLDEAALKSFLEAAENGTELPAAVFTYDRDAAKSLLKGKLNVAPKNATVTYSAAKGKFVANDGSNGTAYDVDAAADAAAAALGMLSTSSSSSSLSGAI